MGRHTFLIAVLLTMTISLHGQATTPGPLPGSDHACKAVLDDGTWYEIWDRVLLEEWEGQPLYLKVRAYYRPGSGEMLWRSTGYSKAGYQSMLKEIPKRADTGCSENDRHVLLLQDGEWADFWAERGRIVIFHSNLKFTTREKAWAYIEQHWREASDDPGSSTKWMSEVLLYDQLGREFFRPKGLQLDARPYAYDSLESLKKMGANWVMEIKGADAPNRATVVLDRNFKLIKVAKRSKGERL